MNLNFCYAAALLTFSHVATAADITRYALPNNNTFPIAAAVEVPAGKTVVYESGKVPAPLDATAEPNSAAYWGNTEQQTVSVLSQIEASLKDKGLGMGDVVKMTVFLVGDPTQGGKMDFSGFMQGYRQFFGTEQQPNLPARSALQIAGLVADGMLVEIEVIAVRP
ncbi:Enamine deaminase RidA, house cleaning of reactive enamine intermediates, YjgF/YER057c/UK114 family [Rheinheimera pacifica]|uniref:Enamine deaminase RidA, house cleaning of reactive enamine intermediates, YjgF/YER057c/UK114 family n=1 Tax=Rheinheimera pacifica TaxID=173990 RepID=A0A1H6MNE8_9GAMM|nr:RidA family protein [Rheinheimera pacifica]SEH99213.1 Enamine deaminase RidA, house cleaning of reactive enamine intermediates, YjgF/YER057c/UK114 family [Rheinheimera pacifica]